MSLTEHIKREVDAAYFTPEEKATLKEITRLFLEQWDSGGSASVMRPVLNRLLQGLPLTSLSGDSDEWEEERCGLRQNKRCSLVFMDRTGKAFDISNGTVRPVTFPFFPE